MTKPSLPPAPYSESRSSSSAWYPLVDLSMVSISQKTGLDKRSRFIPAKLPASLPGPTSSSQPPSFSRSCTSPMSEIIKVSNHRYLGERPKLNLYQALCHGCEREGEAYEMCGSDGLRWVCAWSVHMIILGGGCREGDRLGGTLAGVMPSPSLQWCWRYSTRVSFDS